MLSFCIYSAIHKKYRGKNTAGLQFMAVKLNQPMQHFYYRKIFGNQQDNINCFYLRYTLQTPTFALPKFGKGHGR